MWRAFAQWLKALLPAQGVNALEFPGGNQPRQRIRRNAPARPHFERSANVLQEGLLGQLEVAEEVDQGGQNAARLRLVDGAYIYRDHMDAIGRTSMLPYCAPGIFAATWIASFKSLASMR